MRQFTKNFLQIAPALTAAVLLTVAFQAQAASTFSKSAPLLLAQSAETQKEKQAVEAARAAEAERQKQMQMEESGQQERQMEQGTSKAIQEPPAAAGTRKIGGGVIRDKKGPDE